MKDHSRRCDGHVKYLHKTTSSPETMPKGFENPPIRVASTRGRRRYFFAAFVHVIPTHYAACLLDSALSFLQPGIRPFLDSTFRTAQASRCSTIWVTASGVIATNTRLRVCLARLQGRLASVR